METVGYTLEEMDEIFSAEDPVKASITLNKVSHSIAKDDEKVLTRASILQVSYSSNEDVEN